MLRKHLAVLALAASLLVPGMAPAQQRTEARRSHSGAPAAPESALPELKLSQFTLPNGLNVILHPDKSTPVVAVNVYYHVGSRDEAPGRTGFAHLFEHMLFQGSKNYPGLYNKPLEEAGGSINGTTNEDRTMYFEVVPSNYLELALFLEADRMGNLLDAMTQEKLDNQREVVKNEKRQRLDNQPYGFVFEKITQTMYPQGHPYHWLPIGSMEDLSAASLDDVKEFFRRYYVPNNASLVLAGDFDPAQARRLIEKHFGPIKRGAAVKQVNAPMPKLDREVREKAEENGLPRLYLNWHGSAVFGPDDAALDTLSSVLSSGKGSRLYQALVYKNQLAQNVSAFHSSRQIAGDFQIVATARPGKTLAEIETVIHDEIARLKATPPTAEEMERAFNERESSFIYGLQTALGKSVQLNEYNFQVKRPAYFNQDLARYRQVTAADVQRVANKYLTDKRYVLSVETSTQPKKTGEPAAASPQTATPAPATQQAAGTAPAPAAAATGERPAGAQPQTKTEAAATMPGKASPPNTGAAAAKPQDKTQVDTSHLPKGGPAPTLSLPQLQRRKLSNGLEVLIVEHHELPVVTMNMVVKSGGAADPAEMHGLASATASLLDEGTATRTTLDISNQLAAIGASLNTNAGWDSSNASLLTLTRHLDRALDIYTDVLINPSFPADELARLQALRLAGFRQQKNNPNFIAANAFTNLLYGSKHPYGHQLGGNEAGTNAMKAEDVRRFYETYYRPNNAALIVVGDVRPDALVPKLEKAFAKWESKPVPAVDVSAAPVARAQPELYLIDRPGSAQSVVMVGHVGVPRSTPDYFALLLLNDILGGSFSSRINLNLRENKGYTYGAGSGFGYRRGAGPFTASADVRTAVTKESVEEFLKELREVRGGRPVTAAELDFSKQGWVRSYPGGFETPFRIAGRLADIALHGLPDDYFNNYIQRVNAVTLADVTRAAQRHLDPSRLAIVIVGDRKAIEEKLRTLDGLGTSLTLLDTEGRPVTAGASTTGTDGTGNH